MAWMQCSHLLFLPTNDGAANACQHATCERQPRLVCYGAAESGPTWLQARAMFRTHSHQFGEFLLWQVTLDCVFCIRSVCVSAEVNV